MDWESLRNSFRFVEMVEIVNTIVEMAKKRFKSRHDLNDLMVEIVNRLTD